MGIIEALDYRVYQPNTVQRAMRHPLGLRPASWLFARSLHHIDNLLLRLSHGRVTTPGFLTGLPVVQITTIGARSGLRRSTPLLGIPVGDDLAVIGTHFGQPGTPGWYYNLQADPIVEVAYQGKTVTATAREAEGEEREVIWDRGQQIYPGYEAYARRIHDRPIHVMVLTLRPSEG